jgi:hypothetical protein
VSFMLMGYFKMGRSLVVFSKVSQKKKKKKKKEMKELYIYIYILTCPHKGRGMRDSNL